MHNPDKFAQNLQQIRLDQHLSLTKFSEALHIPRSTMQSILKRGQTSLETACQIANMLQIGLSALTGDLHLTDSVPSAPSQDPSALQDDGFSPETPGSAKMLSVPETLELVCSMQMRMIQLLEEMKHGV